MAAPTSSTSIAATGRTGFQTNGTSDGLGILEFGLGIAQADVAVRRDLSGNLVLALTGTDDRITLVDPISDIDPVVI